MGQVNALTGGHRQRIAVTQQHITVWRHNKLGHIGVLRYHLPGERVQVANLGLVTQNGAGRGSSRNGAAGNRQQRHHADCPNPDPIQFTMSCRSHAVLEHLFLTAPAAMFLRAFSDVAHSA